MTTFYAAVEIEAKNAAEAIEKIESIGDMISIGTNPEFVLGEE